MNNKLIASVIKEFEKALTHHENFELLYGNLSVESLHKMKAEIEEENKLSIALGEFKSPEFDEINKQIFLKSRGTFKMNSGPIEWKVKNGS